MTEQNIVVYKHFCREIFQILVYFLYKNCTCPSPPSPKKITPLLPRNPPLKIEVLSSPPLFQTLVGGSTPLPVEMGDAHYE